MDEPLNEKQNQRDAIIENELKKTKLSLEHGMDFSQSFVSPVLPPEVEGQFLDNIQKWEDRYAQRKTTTVYNMVGRPLFRPASEIPDEEVSVALDEAMELLNKHSIRLDTLCEVDDHELYRFITEELLNLEIDDIRIDGMVRCYTYEEFYPNHPYDIKNRCTEFIRHIVDMEGEETIIPWGLADQITCSRQVYTKEEFNKHVIRFRKSFHSLTLTEFNYLSVMVNETGNEATAIAFVHYTGMTSNGQTVGLTGDCIFNLECKYGWWSIHQFETPWKMIA